MRKALILTVLALFGSETLAQNSFRHAPAVTLDDAQDSEMAFPFDYSDALKRLPKDPNQYKIKFDDFEDDFLAGGGQILNDLLDDEQFGKSLRTSMENGGFIPHDTFRIQNPSFLGSGGSGVFAQGGSAPQGGVQWDGSAQFTGPIGSTGANYIVGGSLSHFPGSPMTITPHVGISKSF